MQSLYDIKTKLTDVASKYATKPDQKLAKEHAGLVSQLQLEVDAEFTRAQKAERARLRGMVVEFGDIEVKRAEIADKVDALKTEASQHEAAIRKLELEGQGLGNDSHLLGRKLTEIRLFFRDRDGVEMTDESTWDGVINQAAAQAREAAARLAA